MDNEKEKNDVESLDQVDLSGAVIVRVFGDVFLQEEFEDDKALLKAVSDKIEKDEIQWQFMKYDVEDIVSKLGVEPNEVN